MKTLFAFAALLSLSATAHAHFIWLVPTQNDDGTTTVNVYFGEGAEDDDPSYLSFVKGAKLHQVQGRDDAEPVELTWTEESVTASIDGDGGSLFFMSKDIGVMDRGDTKFRLMYYAKTGPAITSQTWQWTDTSDDLRLDVVPSYDDGQITLTVHFDGKPVAGAEITAAGAEMDDFEGKTDEDGQARFTMGKADVYSIRAKYVEAEPGEVNGKAYPEIRHYTTIAVEVPEPLSQVASEELAQIEQPVTSFGAALADGHLYVYGGHTGGAHSYSTEEQGNTLTRLNLKTGEWENLADGPHLQGLALVAHDSKLYRIGGFTAKNAEGEDHDLWSQTNVAAFDPSTKSWTDLPPLPEPRSSFDAAVFGDAIYVVGGWSMQGEADSDWHDTAWKLDLSQPSPEWQPLPSPPFQRRALATAAHDGKLYVIGGMQSDGGPTRRVDVFNPQTNEWSQGPDILGDDGMTGFGASAFATGGHLYTSTYKGTLQRLSKDGKSWEMLGKTPTARFFHRMLPLDDEHLLVVGGANMQIGKFEAVEVLPVTP